MEKKSGVGNQRPAIIKKTAHPKRYNVQVSSEN